MKPDEARSVALTVLGLVGLGALIGLILGFVIGAALVA